MERVVNKKHSEWGLASCCIFFFDAILWIFLFLTGSIGNYQTAFIVLFSSFVLILFAFILGLRGPLQKNRKKIFPILGIIFSVLGFLFSGFMFAITTMVQ